MRTFRCLLLCSFLSLFFISNLMAANGPIASTVRLVVSPAASVGSGTPVTLTATVSDANGPVLHGSVGFYDGTRLIATVQVVATNSAGFTPGTATLKTLSLPIGNHSMVAKFNATNADNGSSGTQSLTVTGPQRTVTSLKSSGTTNGSYGLAASVLGGNAPTGSVSFDDQTTGTALGTPSLSSTLTSAPTFISEPSVTCVPVLVADLNGDGIDDLVSMSGYCSALPNVSFGIFLGNGDGTFQPMKITSDPDAGQDPAFPVAADFNNDGVLDLLLGSAIYLGVGDGTFTVKPNSGATGSVVADFNGDGILDLGNVVIGTNAFYNYPVTEIYISSGNGDGTFSSIGSAVLDTQALYSTAVPLAPNSPVLVMSGSGGVGYGQPQYTPSDINDTRLTTAVTSSVLIHDMNGDGLRDIVALTLPSDGSQLQLLVFLQNADTTFTAEPAVSLGTSTLGSLVDILDFNHDGFPDVMAFTPDKQYGNLASNLCVFYGDGSGRLPATPSCYSLGTSINSFVKIGNFFGFGEADVLATNLSLTDPYIPQLLVAPAFSASASLSGISLAGNGLQNIVAEYAGDADFAASTSSPVALDSRSPVTLGLTSSLGTYTTAIAGTAITLTAQASGTSTVPTGTVQFYDYSAALGSPVAITNGVATYTVSTLVAGAHSITAKYSGDETNREVTSNTLGFQVAATGTEQVCALYTGPATISQGSPIQVTAQVKQTIAGPLPTGNVEIDASGPSGSSAGFSALEMLNKSNPPYAVMMMNTATAPLAGGGVVKFSVEYAGDANYPGTYLNSSVTSCTQSQVFVTGVLSATLSTTTAQPVNSGNVFSLTASLQDLYPQTTSLSSPTGMLTLLVDGKVLTGTALGTGLPHSYVFTVNPATPLTAGAHSFTVSYAGDSNWSAVTSPALDVTVKAIPTIKLTSSLVSGSTIYRGSAAQFTATVGDIGGNKAPSGTVQFYDNGVSVGAPVSVLQGAAAFSSSQLAAGAHSVTAAYSGDANYPAVTSSAVTFQVAATTTDTLSVVPSATSTASGSPLTVRVVVNTPSIVGAPGISGTETLKMDGATVTSSAVNGTGLAISLNTAASPITQGVHVFTATYTGDNFYPASTAPAVKVTITGNLPKFTLTSNASSYTNVVQGTQLSFTAAVGAMSGLSTPTGTVQFYIDGVVAGTPVTLAGGTAAFATSSLAAGSHTITASYSGDGNYNSTTTTGTAVVVTQGSDALTLGLAGNNSVTAGEAITVNGSLSVSSLGPAPTGSVALLDGGSTVATTTLSGSSPFAVAFTVNTPSQPLSVGNHAFSLKYAGSGQWAASTTAAQNVTVGKEATQLQLGSSAPDVFAGFSVTFNATLTSAISSPAPTGTVQFLDGTTPLGSPITLVSGKASYTTSALTPGSHSITASYSGDANFAGATSAVTIQQIEDVQPAVSAPTVSTTAGGVAQETITIASLGGLNDETTFACTGTLPQGVSCSFSPATVTGSGQTVLSITTTGATTSLNRWLAGSSTTVLACLAFFLVPRRRRNWAALLGMLLVAVVLVVGCGGGGSTTSSAGSGSGSSDVTPAGNYNITVTSTTGSGANAVVKQVQFQLNVS